MKRKRRSLTDMMCAAHDRAIILRGWEARRREDGDLRTAESAANEAECFEDLADLVGTIIPVAKEVGRLLRTVSIPVRVDGGRPEPPPRESDDDHRQPEE